MSLWKRIITALARSYYPDPKEQVILILADSQNIMTVQRGSSQGGSGTYSLTDLHDDIINQLRPVGKIPLFFLVSLTGNIRSITDECYKLGIVVNACPSALPALEGSRKDDITTKNVLDRALISFADMLVPWVRATHLCLLSGDRDYTDLVARAKRQGLKIIVFSHQDKLSPFLAEAADVDEKGNKLIFFFRSKTSPSRVLASV